MITLAEVLPRANAILNATCAVLLFTGRGRIRRGERLAHSKFMLAAVITSVVFLISYLTRVYLTGTTRFVGAPWLKATYLVVLGSHTLLAMVVVPLVLRTLYLGVSQRFAAHRKIARWTYPIWLYVSITGVVVYVMLYHLADARIPQSLPT
jgi:putative membrane protein